MAFNLALIKQRNTSQATTNLPKFEQNQHASPQLVRDRVLPKLSNAQVNKLTSSYPAWLRNSSGMKQLPGIYQGVLGQVQLQPNPLEAGEKYLNPTKLSSKQEQTDYMSRFTDTERVHQMLSASQLPNESLATIWAHVNKTFPGVLTNREVCLALALIATFQQIDKDRDKAFVAHDAKMDPFILVRSDKKPPVPKLYPIKNNILSSSSPTRVLGISPNSVPSQLSTSFSLIEFFNDGTDNSNDDYTDGARNMAQNKKLTDDRNGSRLEGAGNLKSISCNAISLIDMDGNRFEEILTAHMHVCLKSMNTLKGLFKRSFDILNVENSRASALEALESPQGQDFCRNLGLCYPIAHNIKCRIDLFCGNTKLQLYNEGFKNKISDLMISINEYWAVLINLFHESGQTEFIEFIMDGLNESHKETDMMEKTFEELINELDSSNKPNMCSICQAELFLTKTVPHDALEKADDYGIIGDYTDKLQQAVEEKLLTEDDFYYYHARCANFWLNHIDGKLPFRNCACDILKPSNC